MVAILRAFRARIISFVTFRLAEGAWVITIAEYNLRQKLRVQPVVGGEDCEHDPVTAGLFGEKVTWIVSEEKKSDFIFCYNFMFPFGFLPWEI